MSNKNEYKYTKDGKKVVVIGPVNANETIVREVFIMDGKEQPNGENFVVSGIFDDPPTSWQQVETKKILANYEHAKSIAHNGYREMQKAETEVRAKMGYLRSVLKFADNSSFDLMTAFLVGDIKWVVTTDWLPKVIEWVPAMYESRIRLLSIWGRDDGTMTFRQSTYCDGSENGGGNIIHPCKTKREALKKWKELVCTKPLNELVIELAKDYNVRLPKEAVEAWYTIHREALRKGESDALRRVEEIREKIAAIPKATQS